MKARIPREELGIADTILVSYDCTHGKDVSVLIVGRKRKNQSVEIINAFQGEEADELYNKLVTQKAKEESDVR